MTARGARLPGRQPRERSGRRWPRLRDFSGSINPIVAQGPPKVEKLLDGVETSRARADRVLYQADQIAGQVSNMLARSRAEIERSVTNVRDATDWANKLVQKIYTNPFVLSPFYKPNHEDLRVQAVYDTALVFTKGAQELHDAVKTLEAMAATAGDAAAAAGDCCSFSRRSRMLTEQLERDVDAAGRGAQATSQATDGGTDDPLMPADG